MTLKKVFFTCAIITKKKELNLISCNYSHFPMFSKNELTQMQISNWFCPNLNENEEIG